MALVFRVQNFFHAGSEAKLRSTKTGDLDESRPGPVEHDMVELAGVIIVEGKGTIGRRQEIVSGDPWLS